MILIVSSKRRSAASVADIFHYLSVLSYHTTPMEALNEINTLYHAILIIDPDDLPDKIDYVARVRSYTPGIPVYAISDVQDVIGERIFDRVFSYSEINAELPDKMNEYAEANGLRPIGEYSYAGIDANYYKRFITYFDRAFNFTRTEAMIIRALIAAYPYPVPVRSLLKYAFKASRAPEPSSVRTHISIINKKLLTAGEELAIRMIAGEGYKFLFPHVKHDEISEENTARYKLR